MKLPPEDCIECLRGIKNNKNFDGIGFDHSEFSADFHVLGRVELAGWEGTSIYWDLPVGDALAELLKQTDKKSGEIKFKFGAIRLAREKLDDYAKRYKDRFAYELYPEDGIDYHGNILLSLSLDKARKQTVCGFLANEFIRIHRQDIQNT